MSHAAIVGREYGVPTVTACGTATLQIRDGDEVEVDGDLGTVHLLGGPVSELIAWMDRIPPADAIAAAGEKMGRLAELTALGMRVPRSFAVTVDAFAAHARTSGLGDLADAEIAGLADPADTAPSTSARSGSVPRT